MSNFFTIIVCCLLFADCESKPKVFKLYNSKKTNVLIPYYEDSTVKGSKQQPFLKNLARLMGLEDVSKYNKGDYVRIWLWDGDKRRVVNIFDEEKENMFSIVEFYGLRLNNIDYIKISHEWRNLTPISGWSIFLDSLHNYNFNHVESSKADSLFLRGLTTMSYVQFEISQSGVYHYAEFLEPSYYRKVDKESKKVHELLRFLTRESNIQIYNPELKFVLDPQ